MADDNVNEVVKNVCKEFTYETYASEITEYLTSKLADYNVPVHTIMEIAQYCFTATFHIVNRELRKVHKEYAYARRKGR